MERMKQTATPTKQPFYFATLLTSCTHCLWGHLAVAAEKLVRNYEVTDKEQVRLAAIGALNCLAIPLEAPSRGQSAYEECKISGRPVLPSSYYLLIMVDVEQK